MKKSILFKKLFFAIAFICFMNAAKSQSITYTVTQQPCNAGGIPDGSFTFTVNGMSLPITLNFGDASVNWWQPYPQPVTLTSSYSYTINNWGGAYYSIYATNGSQNAGATILSPPFTYTSIITTPAVCPAVATTSVTISGGTAPYVVNWMNNLMTNVIATGNPAPLPPGGTYRVSITDAAGCVFGGQFQQDSFYVQNSGGISGTIITTPANCTNGTASISPSGGIPPYTYLWSNGASGSSITNLVSNNYNVKVTDSQGCYDIFYDFVPQPYTINTNYTSTPSTCNQLNGSAIAFATNGIAPYTYLWGNGQTGQNLTNVQSGYFSFVTTDANGCVGWGGAQVYTSTPITVTYSSTASQCNLSNGTTTLNITGGTAPYSVVWNTFPSQSGVTATGLLPGNFPFTVTDATGCLKTGSATVTGTSTISGSIGFTSTSCATANGTAQVIASGTAPPLTYLWSTGSTTTSVSNLAGGSYNCQVTDANGCIRNFYGGVQIISPVNAGLTVTDASCLFANDGSIVSSPTGGTAPYTYSWGSNTISNLDTGDYYCHVTDANGCQDWAYAHVAYNIANTSCYCTIEGYAYEDLNTNCIKDPGENGINHVMIGSGPTGYTYTDAAGYYSIKVPSGIYTISENPLGIVNLAPCQNNNQVVNATASTGCIIPIDFGNVFTQVHDVKIHTFSWTLPIPGNPYQQSTVISNQGTFPENNIQLGFAHDGQLNFQNASTFSYTQQNPGTLPDWYSVTSGFPVLVPGQTVLNNNIFNTPTNIPIGTGVVIKDTVAYTPPMSNWLTENSPWNNVEYYTTTVVGPYDPNFKEVSPKGLGAQGYISFNDTVLDYTIHFQNEGTAAAQNVVVADTLDTDLDWMTLQPGWSNHDYVATLSATGILKFTFSNINLPPKGSSPLGSIGIFEYSIEAKPGLANLTQIKNSADIYFDYNAPVKTNTTVNTYDNAVGINHEAKKENGLSVYPNPAGENVMLTFENTENENTFVEVYDISGKLLINQKFSTSVGKNFINLDLRSLSNGLYILKVKNSSGEKTKKVSVAK
ncbi:MAG: T9SS type A sorting domain-containing protein [Bacteroidia bacterium]|nr:T9SS type A sorting domain-containing protein [Bacteroidia bacterium]